MQDTQRVRADNGKIKLHREKPWSAPTRCKILGQQQGQGKMDGWEHWENDRYYGSLRRYESGFAVGNGPYAVIGISSVHEEARHDWRDFQKIKNDLIGEEWEAVELYPAESRLVDPSNRFYLWCVPKGVFTFGFQERSVREPEELGAPQRGWEKR